EHHIDSKIVDRVKQLRESGVKCYLATKQEKYRTEYMKNEMGFSDIFDGIFSSSALRCQKPDPKFFQKILDELEVEGKEVLFFDDEQVNVNGAKRVEIKSFLYTGFEKFEKDLNKFIFNNVKDSGEGKSDYF
ncbi:MAG: HAD-IA family hydrolase, partial [Candidatus Moranbacteria bacterium]|nr:HAD-IA family hydrolase [Candidatus Moranbacteria bacterium]